MNRLLTIALLCIPSLVSGQDVLTMLDAERAAAGVLHKELNTSLPSLTGNAEVSRKKLLDLDDKISLLLQEDARRDVARLNYDRINSLLNDLETLTCDAGAKLGEADGFYEDSDFATSGNTAGECLQYAINARVIYESLTTGIQPWFLKAIEIRGKISTLENYIE